MSEEMDTPEQLAQWVIDNRYSKGEWSPRVSNNEMYHTIVQRIKDMC
jgi:hypothetical protein